MGVCFVFLYTFLIFQTSCNALIFNERRVSSMCNVCVCVCVCVGKGKKELPNGLYRREVVGGQTSQFSH